MQIQRGYKKYNDVDKRMIIYEKRDDHVLLILFSISDNIFAQGIASNSFLFLFPPVFHIKNQI